MKKLTAVYLDDDPLTLEMVRDTSKDSPYLEIKHTFSSPGDFFRSLPKLECDVCFLDIVMPEMDGYTVSQNIDGKPFIFVTGANDVFKTALDLNPIDILTKPVTLERYNKAAEKVIQYYDYKNKHRNYVIFHLAGTRERVKLLLSDIMVVLTNRYHYRIKEIIMRDGSIFKITDYSLEDLMFVAPKLIQINKGELVSSDAVESFSHDHITLKGIVVNGKPRTLTLARSFKKDFLNYIQA